jgi:tellurite resistance protein
MAISGQTGGKLAELIKKAVDDGKVSNSEYDQILAVAESDGTIDPQEEETSHSASGNACQ